MKAHEIALATLGPLRPSIAPVGNRWPTRWDPLFDPLRPVGVRSDPSEKFWMFSIFYSGGKKKLYKPDFQYQLLIFMGKWFNVKVLLRAPLHFLLQQRMAAAADLAQAGSVRRCIGNDVEQDVQRWELSWPVGASSSSCSTLYAPCRSAASTPLLLTPAVPCPGVRLPACADPTASLAP